MLIDKVYKAVLLLSNKDQTGGNISPAEFNKYAEFAQRDWIEDNYNRVDGMGYESNFDVSDLISDVKKVASISLTNNRATKPSDYLHYSSCFTNYIYNGTGRVVPIEVVRDSEWAERLSSEVNKPTRLFPIMRQMSTYFEVNPAGINQIQLTYIKEPLQPWWNYTLSGSTPVFAESSGTTTNPNSGVTAGDSTDFEVKDFNDLVFRICKYFGIEVRDAELYQLTNAEQVQK